MELKKLFSMSFQVTGLAEPPNSKRLGVIAVMSVDARNFSTRLTGARF